MRRALAAFAAAVVLAAGPAAAEPRMVHGADAVFVGDGVRIVWAILRGADEAATQVVLTITAARDGALAVAADGVDPFTGGRVSIAPPAPLAGPRAIRVPRARFAAHPRTELRFGPAAADPATLVVYFNSVPDATPEFGDEAALAAYVARALSSAAR